jgi:hypothetical protein
MELRGAHDAPRHGPLLGHPFLLGLDPEIAHRHLLTADDRHADMMTHARGMPGGQQPPRPLDQDLRCALRRVVARVHHVAAFQGTFQAVTGCQVHPVYRGITAEYPHVLAAPGQFSGDQAAQGPGPADNRDPHAIETTQPAGV